LHNILKALDLSKRNPDYIEDIPLDILIEVCDIVGSFTEIEDMEQDEEITFET